MVDQWDALNCEQPYRKTWPRDKIRDYLQANAGIIYDPYIVDAFLNLLPEEAKLQRPQL